MAGGEGLSAEDPDPNENAGLLSWVLSSAFFGPPNNDRSIPPLVGGLVDELSFTVHALNSPRAASPTAPANFVEYEYRCQPLPSECA